MVIQINASAILLCDKTSSGCYDTTVFVMLINNAKVTFIENSIHTISLKKKRLDTYKTVAEKQLAPESTVSKLVHNAKNLTK